MSPKEAVDRLREDASDREAWKVVDAFLASLAYKETNDPTLREGAVTSVRRKLEDKLLDGDAPEIANPLAYFGNAIRWRVRDLVRRRETAASAAERARLAPPPPPKAEEALPIELLGTMERVVERAVSRRDPWQRDHLRAAWAQIKALHLEGRTLRQIVAAEEGIDPADEPAIQRAVQRAHKAHQRARAAFDEALTDLVAQGRLDPESGADARAVIGRLKRRQDRAAPRVSATGEDSP